MSDKGWLFRRAGSRRWTFAWCPDPSAPAARRQKTLPETVVTRAQARAFLDEHGEALRSEPAASPKAGAASSEQTIANLVEPWLVLRRADARLAGSTVIDNGSHMRAHILPSFGDRRPSDLDVPTLRRWVREKRAAVAPNYCRNLLSTLVVFLDACIGEGWMKRSDNVARAQAVRDELPPARPRAGRSQKLRITTEPAQLLIDSPKVPIERRVRYAVDFTCGCRNGELAGAFVADAHLDAPVPVLVIERALQLKHREGHARLGETKTEDSRRVQPLHPAAVEALRWWLEIGWELFVGRPPQPTDPLFPNRRGKHWRPRSADFCRADLMAVGSSTHVDGHALTFHSLRRSFATWLQAADVPKDIRDRLMGHVPASAGDRHYTEHDLAGLASAVARIPLVWSGVDLPAARTRTEPLLHPPPMLEGAVAGKRKAG